MKKNTTLFEKDFNPKIARTSSVAYTVAAEDKGKIKSWVTLKKNKQKVPVKEGETKKEAVENFIESHENERNNEQNDKDEQTPKKEENDENIPSFERNKPPPDEEAEELKRIEEEQKQEEEERKQRELEEAIRQEMKKKLIDEKWCAEQKAKIQRFKPIKKTLKNGKEILIEFDENTFGKNINEETFNSTIEGWEWKLNNVHKWKEILLNARYIGTSPERGNKLNKKGKIKAAHIGVKEWHYFQGVYKSGTGQRYWYKFHIRDSGEKQYVYELEVHLIKKNSTNS